VRAPCRGGQAGLTGFTRALADKITANCVAPGLIGTERDPKLPLPQHHGLNRILTGRLGSVEDIAAAECCWLVLAPDLSPARPCTSTASCIWAEATVPSVAVRGGAQG